MKKHHPSPTACRACDRERKECTCPAVICERCAELQPNFQSKQVFWCTGCRKCGNPYAKFSRRLTRDTGHGYAELYRRLSGYFKRPKANE